MTTTPTPRQLADFIREITQHTDLAGTDILQAAERLRSLDGSPWPTVAHAAEATQYLLYRNDADTSDWKPEEIHRRTIVLGCQCPVTDRNDCECPQGCACLDLCGEMRLGYVYPVCCWHS